jgi:hypothetical protein
MVSNYQIEKAIKEIDFVIMDFTETIDSLKRVKDVLYKLLAERKANKRPFTRGYRNDKERHC